VAGGEKIAKRSGFPAVAGWAVKGCFENELLNGSAQNHTGSFVKRRGN